jgi:hypothetical protein
MMYLIYSELNLNVRPKCDSQEHHEDRVSRGKSTSSYHDFVSSKQKQISLLFCVIVIVLPQFWTTHSSLLIQSSNTEMSTSGPISPKIRMISLSASLGPEWDRLEFLFRISEEKEVTRSQVWTVSSLRHPPSFGSLKTINGLTGIVRTCVVQTDTETFL